MNKFFSGGLLTICMLFIFIEASQAQSPRERIQLDVGWKFAFGHAANPEKDFHYSLRTIYSKSGAAHGTAIAPGFDDSQWRDVDLPHDWAVELPFVNSSHFDVRSHGFKPVGGHFPETSIGWYRRHLHIPASDSGARFEIQFDGVFRDAKVWINGFYLDQNFSGYIGMTYDITDFINYDRENVLVVRVDATQYEGWFYEGAGIYRHVWLNKFDQIHLPATDLFVWSEVNGTHTTVNIEAGVNNLARTSKPITLRTKITDRNGKEVARGKDQSFDLKPGDLNHTVTTIPMDNPILWGLDHPYLYRVVIELYSEGRLCDRRIVRHGIRTIEVKPNGLFLNGQHIKLQGTNNHQDHAGLGAALPDYIQYYRIHLLKNMGCNAYRASHHAPTPELLEACDSLGMLVMNEQRLLNSGPESMRQWEKLVKRDRNHASIFMWCIGNEEGWIHTNSHGKRIAQTLMDHLKKWDHTRTVTYAADVGNVFSGVNEIIPIRSFNYRQYAVADYHRDHPHQPIIGTEMGSTVSTRGQWYRDSIRAYLPDQDISHPEWGSTAEAWWKLAATNNYWLGGFVWTGFDYRGEPTPFDWPNINSHFGIMDMCGFPKNIYYYYQSWWTDKDVLHISPHWNHEIRWNEPPPVIDVWVNSNADSVELLLNDISLGTKTMPRYGHLNWSVTYQPGQLKAIGYKKGRVITKAIETAGPATELIFFPSRTTIMSDGQDVTVINVSALDSKGRVVPNADNVVRFTVTGDARIIGVGNGDPSSHEPDKCAPGMWQRSLFNGHCQVIVQSGHHPGIIHFEGAANGLWKAETDIVTVSPESVAKVSIDKKYDLKGEAARPRTVDKMLGADISFLPELEERGMRFSDNGSEKDAIEILADHGFNYIRLRIFHDPSLPNGYSPGKGFCDLAHTLAMARRIKAAGMKLLLDFHYSDYWADPGKQYKPAAWKGLDFEATQEALYQYTMEVMTALKNQGTSPDMVQIGNEINHGIVWPDGNVMNIDGTARLIRAGTAAVKAVDPEVTMMLHVALGGQNHETVFFIDQMLARGVHFDVIGQSYYPKWHGTLADLENNLNDMVRRYGKDVIVVEYSALKREVNKIAFHLADGKGKGSCIWEPLNTWEAVFDKEGHSNEWLKVHDELSRKFVK